MNRKPQTRYEKAWARVVQNNSKMAAQFAVSDSSSSSVLSSLELSDTKVYEP